MYRVCSVLPFSSSIFFKRICLTCFVKHSLYPLGFFSFGKHSSFFYLGVLTTVNGNWYNEKKLATGHRRIWRLQVFVICKFHAEWLAIANSFKSDANQKTNFHSPSFQIFLLLQSKYRSKKKKFILTNTTRLIYLKRQTI